jgi:excisionase family DNA binding protein
MAGQATVDADRQGFRAGSAAAANATRTISAREAAIALGVNERTIRRAIRRGELLATKRGRSFQITREALDDYRRGRLPQDKRRRERRPHLTLVSERDPPDSPTFLPGQERQRLATIPTPLTPFIGRTREVATVAALLRRQEVRLVTLTGPGGIGKTRLALRVAEEALAHFDAGAVFVSLATLPSPDLVLPAIARALDVRASPGRPVRATLIAALRDRRLLLILDNFEHLLAAASDLADLLSQCPGVTVLVTSRTPLRLNGEHRVTIPPLALPTAGELPALNRWAEYEAIALFVERARHVRPEFTLTVGNAAAVLEICHRLEGLPLAIELAAAWLRVLSPPALLARLEARLPLLVGGADDQPARLRTMRDAIAWSHALLSDDERRLFRRLGVFVGQFTLEGA